MGPSVGFVSFAGAVRAPGGAIRLRIGSRPAVGSAIGRAIGRSRSAAARAPRVPGRGVQRAQRGVEAAHDQRALQRRAARAEHRDAHAAGLAAGGRAAVRRGARRPRAGGRAVGGVRARRVPAGDPVRQGVRGVRAAGARARRCVARPGRRPGGAVAGRRARSAVAAAAGRANSPLLVEGRAQEGELRAQLLPGQPRRAPGQHRGQLALERGAPGRRACLAAAAAAVAAGNRCSAVLRSARVGRRLATGVLCGRTLRGSAAAVGRLRVGRRVGLAVALALARAGRNRGSVAGGAGAGGSRAGARAGCCQRRNRRKVQHLRARAAGQPWKVAQLGACADRLQPAAAAAQSAAPCKERRGAARGPADPRHTHGTQLEEREMPLAPKRQSRHARRAPPVRTSLLHSHTKRSRGAGGAPAEAGRARPCSAAAAQSATRARRRTRPPGDRARAPRPVQSAPRRAQRRPRRRWRAPPARPAARPRQGTPAAPSSAAWAGHARAGALPGTPARGERGGRSHVRLPVQPYTLP